MENQTRHGKRADTKTQTSISLRADLLDLARQAAEQEGRTFSNLIEQMLKEKFGDSTPQKSGGNAEKKKK